MCLKALRNTSNKFKKQEIMHKKPREVDKGVFDVNLGIIFHISP